MLNRDAFNRLLISVFGAMLITMVVLILSDENAETVFYILGGMFVGAFIWFVGEFLFSVCEKLFPRSILVGYVVLIFLIVLGTTGFSYLLGVHDIIFLIAIDIPSVIIGISITLFYRSRYTKELNEKLQKNKERLE